MPFTPDMRLAAEDAVKQFLESDEQETEGVQSEETEEVSEDQGEEVTEETEAEAEVEEQEEVEEEDPDAEVPTTYYNLDLSEFPPEVRAAIIEEAKLQDKQINRVQRESAEKDSVISELQAQVDELRNLVTQGAEPEAPEYTDEDILRELGFEPDDPVTEVVGDKVLKLAKRVLSLEEQFQAQSESSEQAELQELAEYWDNTLDQLEETQGALPIERQALLAYAVENGITDPAVAFARVTEPLRTAATKAALKKRAEESREQKLAVTTRRPAPSSATTPKATGKVSVQEAMRLAEEQSGVTLSQALKELRG